MASLVDALVGLTGLFTQAAGVLVAVRDLHGADKDTEEEMKQGFANADAEHHRLHDANTELRIAQARHGWGDK